VADRRALIMALLITASVMVLEFVGGFLSGSLALISDAGHMLTDTGALFLSLFALYFSRRPANYEKTYGFYRLEVLSALANGSVLIVIAGFIFYEAVKRFLHPQPINGTLMLWIAAAGLLANLLSALFLSKGSRENLNLRGALWHVLSDALSSVGVIIGAVIIIFAKLTIVDSLLGFLIGLIVLRGAWQIISESADILLESVPQDVNYSEVAGALMKMRGVKDVHDLHIWTIAPGLHALSTHIHIDDALLSECGELSADIKGMLDEKYGIDHITLEFECERCEGPIICPLDKREIKK
jgi:cobalt-zinc-cadmium efflux system protein